MGGWSDRTDTHPSSRRRLVRAGTLTGSGDAQRQCIGLANAVGPVLRSLLGWLCDRRARLAGGVSQRPTQLGCRPCDDSSQRLTLPACRHCRGQQPSNNCWRLIVLALRSCPAMVSASRARSVASPRQPHRCSCHWHPQPMAPHHHCSGDRRWYRLRRSAGRHVAPMSGRWRRQRLGRWQHCRLPLLPAMLCNPTLRHQTPHCSWRAVLRCRSFGRRRWVAGVAAALLDGGTWSVVVCSRRVRRQQRCSCHAPHSPGG